MKEKAYLVTIAKIDQLLMQIGISTNRHTAKLARKQRLFVIKINRYLYLEAEEADCLLDYLGLKYDFDPEPIKGQIKNSFVDLYAD